MNRKEPAAGSRSLRDRVFAGGWSALPSPRRRPLRAKDLLFLSAPVLLLIGYITVGAAVDFWNVRQFDDWWSNGVHLRNLIGARGEFALNAAKATTLEQQIGPEDPDAAVIRLHVPRDEWQALTKKPQDYWGVWLEGELERDKTLHKVKLRRRGDSSVHWTTSKLTFTLKMDDKELLKGFPALIFSSKDVLTQYVAANLASEFELLSPSVFVAPVFMNNRYYGIYRVIEPVDESFVRRVGHMPGNVFRGDAAERGDVFRGVPRGVFMNPYIWDLTAENTRPAAPDSSALISFLSALNGGTFDDHRRMLASVARHEVARMTALMLVVGDLYHMDNVHNQLWYEDPWSGLLHPIPWDLRLLDLAEPPARVNRFLVAALRDPFLVDEIMREVQSRIANDAILRTATQLADGTYARFRKHFEYDRLRSGMVGEVGDPETVRRLIGKNSRLLRTWTNDARVAFHAENSGSDAVILDFETRGYTGADLVGIQLQSGIKGVRLLADRNRNGTLDPADVEVATRVETTAGGAQLRLTTPEALLAGWDTRGKGIRPGSVHYRFFLTGAGGSTAAMRPIVHNRVTGAPATVVALGMGQARTPSASFSPWQYTTARGRTVRWSGTVRLATTERIAEQDTLVIAAGTRVRLDRDVSLIVRGRVYANGTAAAPISFEPTDSAAPWGAVALQGTGADHSRLQHVRFVRGGGSVVDRIEYSGMVSVHYARHVVFKNAAFLQNLRSDDSFHAMHAGVDLLDCHFSDSNGDAVDYDYSVGRIEGCRIEGSRNDAVDLMTSSPEIYANTLVGSGDKGISIGEDSHPLVFNNTITDCVRGIEVKDRSGPLIVNNTITRNQLGIYAHLKNWRYGSGGWPRLVNTIVAGNKENFSRDQNSRITSATGSAGAKQTGGASAAPQLEWVYAASGIRTDAVAAGVAPKWRSAARMPPLIQKKFGDDFASVSDGWLAGGGVTLLEKRNYALIAGLERNRGSVRRSVDLRVPEGSRRVLVLELAARDVAAVVVSAHAEQGSISRTVQPGPDISSFQYVELLLEPGRYDALEIAATPLRHVRRVDRQTGFVDLRAARIELGSWALYDLPRTGWDSQRRIAQSHRRP